MEEIDGWTALLATSLDDAHQDTLGMSTCLSAVPAPDFAIDDSWADGLFGSVVGGIQTRFQQIP